MGNTIVPPGGQSSYILSNKQKTSETYNTRVAMWQLPYNKNYVDYDGDDSRWFETNNKWGENELDSAEHKLHMSMTRYKVHSKTTKYSDNSYEVESKYPNKTTVVEKHEENHVWVWIKDKFNKLVAEKIYNNQTNDGCKTIYKNIQQGENTFTVVRVYSYDTTKNKATDVVNFAYTSLSSALTKGCKLEKEYYLLNGKHVQASKTDDGGYEVRNKDGKILTFLVE